ncbi:MAG: H/ACA ribonucleoprotein complex subunit GAR1 [Nitrososphaerales archaeon]
MHIAKSGRVIVKLNQSVKLNSGDLLLDSKGKKVAKVTELIGSVKAPYASAIPMTDRIKSYVGRKIYSGGSDKRRQRRR